MRQCVRALLLMSCAACCFKVSDLAKADDAPREQKLAAEAVSAMKTATQFMRDNVAVHGGYVFWIPSRPHWRG